MLLSAAAPRPGGASYAAHVPQHNPGPGFSVWDLLDSKLYFILFQHWKIALLQYRSTSQSRVIEFALMLQHNTLAFFPLCLQREINMAGYAFSTQHFVYYCIFWKCGKWPGLEPLSQSKVGCTGCPIKKYFFMHNVHITFIFQSCNFKSKMIMKQHTIFCIHFYLNIQKYVLGQLGSSQRIRTHDNFIDKILSLILTY